MTQQRFDFDKKDAVVVQIMAEDAKRRSDAYLDLRELVLSSEPMYPDIAKWFDHKVTPGIITSQRVALLGFVNGTPIASAVVKRGQHAKFCHLRIGTSFQEQHLGELFFALMTLGVRSVADEVHFTLPESLWEQRNEFFHSFGFGERRDSGTQYRLFDRELRCSARFNDVWIATLGKLPRLISEFSSGGFALDSSLLMSVKPRWAEAILRGQKRVEIRRTFSARWEGHRAALYATTPMRKLVGEARVARVDSGAPEQIWAMHGDAIGCDRAAFDQYARGAKRIFAISLDDVKPFSRPVSLKDLAMMLGEALRPPQSYAEVTSRTAWGRCISIAALINGSATTAAMQLQTR